MKNNSTKMISKCIDLLCRFYPYAPNSLKDQIKKSISSACRWVIANQVEDNGFVFRLNESFSYGHVEMYSDANSGAMFPTWFRTLSLAYLIHSHGNSNFQITNAPGLEQL